MMNGALDDMIAAADSQSRALSNAPSWWADTDFSTLTLPDFSGSIVAPVLDLPSTGDGLNSLFRNITQLVQVGYQGQAMVQQQKALNKIAQAQLENRLETVRTTPNIWLVGGLVAAGFFALQVMDRRK